MTPADQCKADVEAWLFETWKCQVHMDGKGPSMAPPSVQKALPALIARLTPVYERAQIAERGPGMKLYQEMRERAERAEARWNDATAFCCGLWPCEASTAAASLERERNDAEADVARLREVLQRIVDAPNAHRYAETWAREALAATERR